MLTKSALVAHLASIGRKSAGTFMLPGLLKITVTSVAAKPATVKVKVRPMKKLKDAAKA